MFKINVHNQLSSLVINNKYLKALFFLETSLTTRLAIAPLSADIAPHKLVTEIFMQFSEMPCRNKYTWQSCSFYSQ
ncbi:hypothetical protein [Nostoc sp.]|uniref:hypothetical protein n=1 Tax=Nostoc sp. TaxID=1180 RepID=UPI002FFCCED4